MKNKFLYISIITFLVKISFSQMKDDSLKNIKNQRIDNKSYETILAKEYRRELIFERLYRNILYYEIREKDYLKLKNNKKINLNNALYYNSELEINYFLSIPLIGTSFYFNIIDTKQDYVLPSYRIYAVQRIEKKDYKIESSIVNCKLKKDTVLSFHNYGKSSTKDKPIIYLAIDSTHFLIPDESDSIYYLSGSEVYLSAIASHFKLDKTKPETYYEFLKFKTLSYNVKSTFKYETTAKGKIVFTADADKDLQYVFLVDEKFPDDIMVKYILKKNKK